MSSTGIGVWRGPRCRRCGVGRGRAGGGVGLHLGDGRGGVDRVRGRRRVGLGGGAAAAGIGGWAAVRRRAGHQRLQRRLVGDLLVALAADAVVDLDGGGQRGDEGLPLLRQLLVGRKLVLNSAVLAREGGVGADLPAVVVAQPVLAADSSMSSRVTGPALASASAGTRSLKMASISSMTICFGPAVKLPWPSPGPSTSDSGDPFDRWANMPPRKAPWLLFRRSLVPISQIIGVRSAPLLYCTPPRGLAEHQRHALGVAGVEVVPVVAAVRVAAADDRHVGQLGVVAHLAQLGQ